MVYKLPTNAIEPSNVTQALLAEDVKNALVPIGGIIMWSGTIADLANMTSWQLCDGTNGAPDLRNKFIVGAWEDSGESAEDIPGGTAHTADTNYPYLQQEATGGSADATLVAHSHTTNSTSVTLTGAINGISESFDAGGGNANGVFTKVGGNSCSQTPAGSSDSGNCGGVNFDGQHSHDTDSKGDVATNENLPPYFALAFIKRVS